MAFWNVVRLSNVGFDVSSAIFGMSTSAIGNWALMSLGERVSDPMVVWSLEALGR